MDDDDWFHLSESWSWTVVVPSWWSFQNYYLVLRRFAKEQAKCGYHLSQESQDV